MIDGEEAVPLQTGTTIEGQEPIMRGQQTVLFL